MKTYGFRTAVSSACLLATIAAPVLPGARAQSGSSRIRADEVVVFFPTAANLSEDGQTWNVPIHGWIFEPEDDDLLRAAALRELDDALDDRLTPAESAILDERLRLFLVDNERGKLVGISIADTEHVLPPSAADGHFLGSVQLPKAAVDARAADGPLRIQATLASFDSRAFLGTVYCLPPTGVSVVSDVDDTIKVTSVRDPQEMLANTFLREMKPVDGMAGAYRRWAEAGAHFHYVSAAPWQLYPPLAEFTRTAGFPDGDFHLKRFRLKDSTSRNLFADPLEVKLATIEPLVQRFPKRQFILIGDSGERDPEAYAELARRHPEQIRRIYIRDVTGDTSDSLRYLEAFRDVPPENWRIFNDAAQLDDTLR